jgi:serine protease Do
MEHIQIRHQSGSMANQTERFSLVGFTEITFGRDDLAQVKYDPNRDDLVSRQHARLSRDKDNPAVFILTDLDSRNGTFVNKKRIKGEVRINHGDRIQFGSGGPEFIFELDPPPVSSPATRMAPAQTRVQATQETSSTNVPPPTSEFRHEGRVTMLERQIQVERSERAELDGRLQDEKHSSRKHLINVAAVLLGVLVLAGMLVYHEMETQRQLKSEIVKAEDMVKKSDEAAKAANDEIQTIKAVKTPHQIADLYSKSTVLIESNWELVDTSGRKIYHKYIKGVPVYIKWPDGSIEPYNITFEDEENGSRPIAGSIVGSGFVSSHDGFILTNRHIAAPWRNPCTCILKLPGKLYIFNSYKENDYKIENFRDTEENRNKLRSWKPKNSPILTWKGLAVEGRHVKLTVTFPKTSLPFPARLVRESDAADVALLKIDSLDVLQDAPLGYEDKVMPGDTVTTLGYPNISPNPEILIKSKEPNNPDQERRTVPEPTVTSGGIGKIIKDNPETSLTTVRSGDRLINVMGDLYQLTINATGDGNSGGPVFNDQGRVIGIFTYRSTDLEGITITYAVPIEYGVKLKANLPTIR